MLNTKIYKIENVKSRPKTSGLSGKKIVTTILMLMAVMMTNVQNANAQWTTANLSAARYDLSATAVGTKVFFAGGRYGNTSYSSVVDIYDNSTGLWTTANLSAARTQLSATAVGTKVFFAGGNTGVSSSVVDIYDNSTGLWTIANLSLARWGLSAATVGTKAFFAGGYDGNNPSSVVDIYDNTSTSINDINQNEGINIYPNPTTGIINIDGISNETIIVYNSFGARVKELKDENKIDLSSCNAGLYFVQILNSSGKIINTSKILRQ